MVLAVGSWLLFFFVLGEIVGRVFTPLWARSGRCGGRDLERVLVRLRPCDLHRGLLRRAGYQISEGGWVRHLIQQRLQQLVRELHGGLRRGGGQPHLGQRAEPGVLQRLPVAVHQLSECSRRARVSGDHRVHQLLRHLRVAQAQSGVYVHRDHGSVADSLDRGRDARDGGEPARAFEFKEGVSLLPAVLTGTVLAFYALIGFDDAVNVAQGGEVSEQDLPARSSAACSPPASSTCWSPSPRRWWCRRASSPHRADRCWRSLREVRSRSRPCCSLALRLSLFRTGLLSIWSWPPGSSTGWRTRASCRRCSPVSILAVSPPGSPSSSQRAWSSWSSPLSAATRTRSTRFRPPPWC